MSFSSEDKTAWFSSEVMREFEKIAEDTSLLNGPPEEAFLPIGEEQTPEEDWEDENAAVVEDEVEALGLAGDELFGSKTEDEPTVDEILELGDLHSEASSLYRKNLLTNLEDLAHDLAEQGHIKVAYRIERTIRAIKVGGSK